MMTWPSSMLSDAMRRIGLRLLHSHNAPAFTLLLLNILSGYHELDEISSSTEVTNPNRHINRGIEKMNALQQVDRSRDCICKQCALIAEEIMLLSDSKPPYHAIPPIFISTRDLWFMPRCSLCRLLDLFGRIQARL
jgi:hypothetical protein